MEKDKANDGMAAYVGVSAPETPKYLLTNNFLCEYFEQTGDEARAYCFQELEDSKVLDTEDIVNREQLQVSFDCFLKRYLGEDTIREGNRRLKEGKHFYFPLIQDMLISSSYTLRHILFHLQNLDDDFDYNDMRKKLADYIFHDTVGINHIFKILFRNQEGEIRYRTKPESTESTQSFWAMLNEAEHRRMKKLGQCLNEDLNTMLTHEYFCKLDFYRRYNYLSILLTGYVIQYIVRRKGANACLLCKGAPQDNRLNGMIHRACCSNYADIRGLFPTLLQKYYSEVFSKSADEEGTLRLLAKEGIVMIEGRSFMEFTTEALGSKKRNTIEYDSIKKAFALEENIEKPVTSEEFALRYINLTRTRRGSSLTKISSVLPTSGRQIDFIFPQNNAKQKYFAMSGSITEFYVRLYLAGKHQQYDYLDNFMEHLQERYHIVLTKSQRSDKMLKTIKTNLSALDFAKNKMAFIDTLNSINCLIKLSDSGYVITLPEEKGDFKLI